MTEKPEQLHGAVRPANQGPPCPPGWSALPGPSWSLSVQPPPTPQPTAGLSWSFPMPVQTMPVYEWHRDNQAYARRGPQTPPPQPPPPRPDEGRMRDEDEEPPELQEYIVPTAEEEAVILEQMRKERARLHEAAMALLPPPPSRVPAQKDGDELAALPIQQFCNLLVHKSDEEKFLLRTLRNKAKTRMRVRQQASYVKHYVAHRQMWEEEKKRWQEDRNRWGAERILLLEERRHHLDALAALQAERNELRQDNERLRSSMQFERVDLTPGHPSFSPTSPTNSP